MKVTFPIYPGDIHTAVCIWLIWCSSWVFVGHYVANHYYHHARQCDQRRLINDFHETWKIDWVELPYLG